MQNSARSLVVLLNDVLELALADAKVFHHAPSRITSADLVAALEEVAVISSTRAAQSQLSICLDFCDFVKNFCRITGC